MIGKSRPAREGRRHTVMLSPRKHGRLSAFSTWLSIGRYRLVRVVWHFQVRQHERLMKEVGWLFPPTGERVGLAGDSQTDWPAACRPERGGRGQKPTDQAGEWLRAGQNRSPRTAGRTYQLDSDRHRFPDEGLRLQRR